MNLSSLAAVPITWPTETIWAVKYDHASPLSWWPRNQEEFSLFKSPIILTFKQTLYTTTGLSALRADCTFHMSQSVDDY